MRRPALWLAVAAAAGAAMVAAPYPAAADHRHHDGLAIGAAVVTGLVLGHVLTDPHPRHVHVHKWKRGYGKPHHPRFHRPGWMQPRQHHWKPHHRTFKHHRKPWHHGDRWSHHKWKRHDRGWAPAHPRGDWRH